MKYRRDSRISVTQSIKERIKKLREVSMEERSYSLHPAPTSCVPLEGSRNSLLSQGSGDGDSALLRSSLVCVLCRSKLTVGHAAVELGSPVAMRMIRVQNDRGQ